MAITRIHLEMLLPFLKSRPGATVLSLGHPDLLVSDAELRDLFGESVVGSMTFCSRSKETLQYHRSTLPGVFDPHELFERLHMQLTCVDVKQQRGCERHLDLNEPVAAEWVASVDIVIDPGTLEHCFDIASAMRNISKVLRIGGLVMHTNPVNVPNHGFYSISPTFYFDFYSTNGFTIERYAEVERGVLHPTRPGEAAHGTCSTVLAMKRESTRPRTPLQGCHLERAMIECVTGTVLAKGFKRIALVPAGGWAAALLEPLRCARVTFSVFDNAAERVGTVFGTTPIEPMAVLGANSQYDAVFVVSSSYGRFLRDQLLEQGVDERRILMWDANQGAVGHE